MNKKRISILAAILLMTALAACGGLGKAASGTEKAPDKNAVTFETTDIDGNQVSSADIFSQHKITMVNIWGTFCGPCIDEMPDLEVLSGRLAEKDCAIIGIVCDVVGPKDVETIKDAREIIETTGVTYLNLLPWSEMNRTFPAMYVPTTYFVDSSGNIVGKEAVGSRDADDYEGLVDGLLGE